DRQIKTVTPAPPHQIVQYDNLGRVVAHAVFKSDPSAIDTPLSDRGRYSTTSYDQRGLVYKESLATSATSSSPTFLETHRWYDQTGRVVGEWAACGPMIKTTFDGLGTTEQHFVTDRHDGPAPGGSGNYSAVFSVGSAAAVLTGDVVF